MTGCNSPGVHIPPLDTVLTSKMWCEKMLMTTQKSLSHWPGKIWDQELFYNPSGLLCGRKYMDNLLISLECKYYGVNADLNQSICYRINIQTNAATSKWRFSFFLQHSTFWKAKSALLIMRIMPAVSSWFSWQTYYFGYSPVPPAHLVTQTFMDFLTVIICIYYFCQNLKTKLL